MPNKDSSIVDIRRYHSTILVIKVDSIHVLEHLPEKADYLFVLSYMYLNNYLSIAVDGFYF